MKLYERGKFQLDDPLEMYVPEFANLKVYAGLDDAGQPKYEDLKRKPTMRDIMRHTAGLANDELDKTAVGDIYRKTDPRAYANSLPEFIQKLATIPLAYQPGTRWAYSQSVDVQAYLVQKISGVPFDKFLDLHIFKPLGHDHDALHHPATSPMPTGRGLRRCTRANDDGSFTRQSDEEAYSSTVRPGRSSPAISAWWPPSTTT